MPSFSPLDVENVRVQNGLVLVDVLNKTLHAAHERKIFFLAAAQIVQTNPHAVIQERQFANPLGQNVVVIFDIAEDRLVGHEVHFGAAVFGVTHHLNRRHSHAVDLFDHAVLRHATVEFHEVLLAVTAHGKAQP